ncbi:MAG: hypothetical protein ACTS6J_23585 [Burkholderiales bacterium]
MQQLDIFADSVPVQRANALIAALSRFDRTASRQALQMLASADPEHAGLAHFQVLCAFVDNWPDAGDAPGWLRTPAAVAEAVQLIRERIIPAAVTMGNAGMTLVRKCWSDLARESEAADIGPEHPDCFAAELYLRAAQSSEVVRTAQRVPGAAMRAAVQRWLGLGYHRCGETELSRSAVLRYAWLAPQRFSVFVEEIGDAALARDWRNFQADLGDLDATWFPAWCAHEKKGGVTLLDNLPEGDGPTAYRLVAGLTIRERGGLCSAVYEDRAHLKRLSESFFAFYLRHRSDLHPRQR